MSDQTRPNLFHYATSELSQDAFICWLAAWADPKFKDGDNHALHQAGTDFIRSMIAKKHGYDVAIVKAVKVRRQVGKLDVLIEINKPSPDGEEAGELAILIEDKTHTFDHGTQLADYYDHVVGMGYTEEKMIPLYFKTGYQSRFDRLDKYETYLRKDFLDVLTKGKESVKNAIYQDFLAHLKHMEDVVNQYEKKDITLTEGPEKWAGNDWRGLFMALYDRFKEDNNANWGYVPNASGGFFGFWWYFRPKQKDAYTPYLQLENHELCFKIAVDDNQNRSEAREEVYWHLIKTNEQFNFPVERPGRMGNGKFMTVLLWKGDYRELKDGRKLDMTATLENLKKAQMLLDAAFGI